MFDAITYRKEYQDKYLEKYPYRGKATRIVAYQIEQGNIVVPQKCFLCFTKESKRLVGHHENYAYPLEVDWLCDKCHKKRHDYLASIGWVDYIKRPVEGHFSNMIQPEDLRYTLDSEVKDAINSLFEKVNYTYREKEVIKLRAASYTLEEIGRIFRMCRENVRCILNRAERKYDFYEKLSVHL